MSREPAAIAWRGARFRYPGAAAPALAGVDLAVRAGEMVLLTGPTGCGKSTLLKTANGLIPRESEGTLEGEIALFGRDARTLPSPLWRAWAGFLFQNPGDQLLCARVQEEVAFGPENLGRPPGEIARRVEAALDQAAAAALRPRRCQELSGGEQQRVALASVLALRPRLLLLDEPTSQLDGRGAEEVLASLARVRARSGAAVLIAEHRVERILPMADRLVVMDRGRIRGDFPRGRFARARPLLEALGLEVPLWMTLAERHGPEGAEGEAAVFERLRARDTGPSPLAAPARPAAQAPAPPRAAPPLEDGDGALLRAEGLAHRYRGAPRAALDGVSLRLRPGEILALMGHNGSGKSTLLALLAGLLSAREGRKGKVAWFGRPRARPAPYALAGRVGFLFQNPDLMLTAATAAEEVASGPRHLGFAPGRRETAVAEALARFGLEGLAGRNPFSLSRGERLRLALASLIACGPRVLLLDEPTAGLDRGMRWRLLEDLRRWVRGKEESGEGRGAIVCTHDAEAALAFADRVAALRDGRLIAEGPAAEVLAGAGEGGLEDISPPALVRLARWMGWAEVPRTAGDAAGGFSDVG